MFKMQVVFVGVCNTFLCLCTTHQNSHICAHCVGTSCLSTYRFAHCAETSCLRVLVFLRMLIALRVALKRYMVLRTRVCGVRFAQGMSVRAPMHSHDVCAFMLSFAHGADLLHLRRHIFIAPFISCVLESVNLGSAITLVQANMGADAKRRRKLGLRGLLHTGRCSMAGLAEIIGKIKATPSVLDGPSSKTTLKK